MPPIRGRPGKRSPEEYAPPAIFFDYGEALEEVHEWCLQDPFCAANAVEVPLCQHDDTQH